MIILEKQGKQRSKRIRSLFNDDLFKNFFKPTYKEKGKGEG